MKKNVLWILLLIIVLPILTGAGAAANEEDQLLVIRLVSSTEVSSTVSLSNNTGVPIHALYALAAYAQSGRMLGCSMEEHLLEHQESTELTISWDFSEKDVHVKAFVLDSETLSPLRSAWEMKDLVPKGNVLIAWFSRANNILFAPDVDAVTSASINLIDGEAVGNAKLLADMAEAVTGGDVFAIETEEKYPSAYRATTDQARDEQSSQARPKLSTHVANWNDYNTIILIYPCWWGGLPMPVYTFLEEYDFTGKTILPLCTHEGSGMGSTQRDIADACSGATVLTGLAVRGGNVTGAESTVENWLRNTGMFET